MWKFFAAVLIVTFWVGSAIAEDGSVGEPGFPSHPEYPNPSPMFDENPKKTGNCVNKTGDCDSTLCTTKSKPNCLSKPKKNTCDCVPKVGSKPDLEVDEVGDL